MFIKMGLYECRQIFELAQGISLRFAILANNLELICYCRTDKKQHFADKVAKVESILAADKKE